MRKISLEELNNVLSDGPREDHPGRKGLYGKRSTREFGRHRPNRSAARENAKALNGKRV